MIQKKAVWKHWIYSYSKVVRCGCNRYTYIIIPFLGCKLLYSSSMHRQS